MEELVRSPKTLVTRIAAVTLAAALPLAMASCAKGGSPASSQDSGGTKTISMWTHNAGNKAELDSITAIVNDYNASQTKYKVGSRPFPRTRTTPR